jgi:DNA adenine methylase
MLLWERIIADSSALADDYEQLWRTQLSGPRVFYDDVRAKFNATKEPHLLLLSTCALC